MQDREQLDRVGDQRFRFGLRDGREIHALKLARSAALPFVRLKSFGMNSVGDELLAVGEELDLLPFQARRIICGREIDRDLREGDVGPEGESALWPSAESNGHDASTAELRPDQRLDLSRGVLIVNVDVQSGRARRQDFRCCSRPGRSSATSQCQRRSL